MSFAEIHLNYHVDRMFAAITRRCAEKGITTNTIADRLRSTLIFLLHIRLQRADLAKQQRLMHYLDPYELSKIRTGMTGISISMVRRIYPSGFSARKGVI